MAAVFLDMDQVVASLEQNPSRWTLGPHCEIASDPGQWGHSLVNNAEILTRILDAASPTSVVEVGAYAGDTTRFLLRWAEGRGATVGAIDPLPQPSLSKLAEDHSELSLILETSLEALTHIACPEAAVIDGDHNYYTVSEECRLIAQLAEGSTLSLLIFHDVKWPHARRDHYYTPEQIPADQRMPYVNGGIFPGDDGIRDDGLPYTNVATKEGGPRNGVLTAIEDFVKAHEDLELAIIPSFFGVGVVWSRNAPYAQKLVETLEPFDRNPVIERLEDNRVLHLASMHSQAVQSMLQGQKIEKKNVVLRKLLDSSAITLGEQVSRLRQRQRGGGPAFTRDEIRRALDD
jgi:hypothetical protein